MTPQEFETAFPKVMAWIRQTLLAHEMFTRPVTSTNFKRLLRYFSQAQIEVAKFVVVDRIPVPPLSSIGLSQFKEFERGSYDGITHLDTYFLNRAAGENESLHFHEMIHVVQWRLLGAEFFSRCMQAAWRNSGIATVRLKKWRMMRKSYLIARDRSSMRKSSWSGDCQRRDHRNMEMLNVWDRLAGRMMTCGWKLPYPEPGVTTETGPRKETLVRSYSGRSRSTRRRNRRCHS